MMTTARAQGLRSAPAILLIATAVLALPAQSLRPLSRAQLCVTEGALEPGASAGPVGVRSDNVRLTFVLAGAPESAATRAAQSPCLTDAGE
jgi:hypothetical protein